MNNSLVKLEDFQLDEISGGITAKQVAKNTAGYAIKGTLSVAFGVASAFATMLVMIYSGATESINIKCGRNFGYGTEEALLASCLIHTISGGSLASLVATGGWKLGEWICKKIGLED